MEIRPPRYRMMAAAAAGALGVTLALGACSSSSKGASSTISSEAPPQAVATAISNVEAASSVRMDLTLAINAGQAQQLAAAGGGSKISSQEANALTSGSIFFAESTGSGEALDSAQARTDPKDAYDFGLKIGTGTPLEILYVGQNLYLRAQLGQLLTDVGQNPSKASKITSELGSLNRYVPGLADLAKGNWVEISHASLQSLAPLLKQMQSGAGAGAGAGQAGMKAAITKLRAQVLAAIQADSTFARLTQRGAYRATVNVAKLVQTVKPEIEAALATVPGVGSQISSSLDKAARSVPAGQTAVIDLYATGGKLTEADIDLNQFAKHKMSFPVPLRVALSSPGAPSAPSGATTLDLSKLPTLLGSLLGGKTSSA